MRKIFITLINFLLCAGMAFSAPSITSVTGNLQNGQSITISGSSFGSSGPNILFFDNFESGVPGQNIAVGANSAVIGEWGHIGVVPPVYTNVFHHGGSQAFMASSDPDVEAGNYGKINLPGVTELFVAFWCMVPVGDDWPGEHSPLGVGMDNWKITWFDKNNTWGGAGDNDLMLPVKLAGNSWYVEGNTAVYVHENPPYGNGTLYPTYPDMRKGTWKRFWYWYQGDVANGNVRFYNLESSGVETLIDDSGVPTILAGDTFNYLSINAYTRKQDKNYTARQLFDDVYVATGANAQARVEIGDASTYAACTNLTIATVTYWSASSITATVRSGSFTDLGSAYLYVFDSNGAVNSSGYLLRGVAPPEEPPNSGSGGSGGGGCFITTLTVTTQTDRRGLDCRKNNLWLGPFHYPVFDFSFFRAINHHRLAPTRANNDS
jgi:hypothetical protein